MVNHRTRKITISLTDDEADAWDSVRNRTVPEGIAARIMLLQAVDFLAQKGRQQRRDVHLASAGRTTPPQESGGIQYDYSDAQ